MGWWVAAIAAVSGVLIGASSCNEDPKPLGEKPGTTETRALGEVVVPGAWVDVAGLNLRIQREDFRIDTLIGPHVFGATYNSADGVWRWTHQMTYGADVLIDYTGAQHDVASLVGGDAIHGTWWIVLDDQHIRTKGGLVHEFEASELSDIYWASDPYPRIRFLREAGRPTQVVQCSSPQSCQTVYEFEYDAAGRLSAVEDRSGRRSEYAWDATGRLVQARDPLDVARGWSGRVYEYDGAQITAVSSSEGERILYTRSGDTLQVRAEGEESPTWRFHREPKLGDWLHTRVVDPIGHESVYAYDLSRRLREVLDPLGDTVTWEWSGARPVQLTLRDGTTWSWILDGDDIQSEIQPSGNVVEFQYEPTAVNRGAPLSRALSRVEDSLGLIFERRFDPDGRPVKIVNGAGEVLRLAYGQSGELVSTTSADGRTIGLDRYGEHGHAERLVVDGDSYDRVFDRVGNLLRRAAIEPDTPGVHSREFDEDRNVSVLLTAEQLGVYTATLLPIAVDYRSDHRISSIARLGPSTSFVYDALGRPTERWQSDAPGWSVTRFEWTPRGRLAAAEGPGGARQEYAFDPVGRLVWQAAGQVAEGGPMVPQSAAWMTWEQGRVAGVFDSAHSGVEAYEYDAAGRLVTLTFPDGETASLTWDLRSRLAAMYLEDSASGLDALVDFGYDAAGRENHVGLDGSLLMQRALQGGRLAEVVYGNGLTRRFALREGLEQSSETVDGLGNVVAQTSVTRYGGEGGSLCLRHEASTFGVSVRSVEESWCLGLTPAPRMAGAPGEDTIWWSSLGSPKQIGDGSFDSDYLTDRLLQIRQGPTGPVLHDYVYDAAGRVIERDGRPLSWDAAGRATSTAEWLLEWDGLGRPLAEEGPEGRQTRRFGGMVEADSEGNPVALDLGEVRINLASGERLYRHFDPRGNVAFTTDRDGQPRALYRYHAFGIAEVQGTSDDRVRFALGRQLGDLVLLGHRLFDPAAARFLAPDPVFQLLNQYTYANGNSLFWWDPAGLEGTFHGATAGHWAASVGVAAATGLLFGVPGAPALVVVGTVLQVVSEGGGFPWEGDKTVGDVVDRFAETANRVQRRFLQPMGEAAPLGLNGLSFEALPVGSVARVIGFVGEGPRGPGPGPSKTLGGIPICSPMGTSRRVSARLLGVLLCVNIVLGVVAVRGARYRDRS